MPTAPDPAPPPSAHAGTVVVVERAAVLLLFALLLFGVFRILEPFAVAILFGAFLAIATWPLRAALVRRGLRRGLAATLMLLVVLLLVALPLLALAPSLPERIADIVALVRAALATAPQAPPGWVTRLPLVGDDAERLWGTLWQARNNLETLLTPYYGVISSTLIRLGQSVAESAAQFALALVVTTTLWTGGDSILAQLRDVALRLGGATGLAALEAAGGAVRGVAWGIVGTAALQGFLLGLGLRIAGVPGAIGLGFLGFVFSLSQILGPLIVVTWAGAAWWLYNLGQEGWALFVLLWGLILVSGSDNIVRPLLIRRGVDMPLTLIILGVFGGLIAFGFLGLFLGPALLAVAHALLRAWRGAAAAA
jgi:predicted PurR-regulated permease PerM